MTPAGPLPLGAQCTDVGPAGEHVAIQHIRIKRVAYQRPQVTALPSVQDVPVIRSILPGLRHISTIHSISTENRASKEVSKNRTLRYFGPHVNMPLLQ